MLLSTEMLVGEADRLLARAERAVRRHRELGDTGVSARRAQQELSRLQLYRAVLVSANTARAVMPEYAALRGFLGHHQIARASILSRERARKTMQSSVLVLVEELVAPCVLFAPARAFHLQPVLAGAASVGGI